MSIHSSLKVSGKLGGHRNVLTRPERLAKLLEEGRREETDSVFGLQKVRNIMMKTKKTKKEKEGEEGEAGTDVAATEGEAKDKK
jgi:small basic protein (TIGR04137 family)